MKAFKLPFLLMLMQLVSIAAIGQELAVINSLEQGQFYKMVQYLDTEIQLEIPQHEGSFSKQEAENKLNNFFNTEGAYSFSVIHQGCKKQNQYIIGELKTKNNQYRMQLLIRNATSNPKIQQVRIN